MAEANTLERKYEGVKSGCEKWQYGRQVFGLGLSLSYLQLN